MKKVVETRKDIMFHIVLFPIIQLHPEAYMKSKAIVCEKSNKKALKMLEDAFDKKSLPDPSCDTDAIDRNIALGKKYNIRGTPTIIFQDGSRKSGAVQAGELIKLMESKKR
jgi:thiol:disulfide interchange protein DsbC